MKGFLFEMPMPPESRISCVNM